MLAKQHHPDKSGDAAKFRAVSEAYQVLSDPEKRRLYDMGCQSDSGASRKMPRQKTQDVVQPLKVTLEQLYSGASKKMAVTRQVVDKKKGVKEC